MSSSLFKSIFVRRNAASEPCRTLSRSWKQMGPAWPPPCRALLHPAGDTHGPHAAAPARGAEGTLPAVGMPPARPPSRRCRCKVVGAGKARAYPTHPSAASELSPGAPELKPPPEGPRAPCPSLAEGEEEEEDAWVGDRACSSLPPQHLPSQNPSARAWPRLGAMLPSSVAPAWSPEHPEPAGWCWAQRGNQLRPHSHASQPYRREGAAVLPWRKGSS